MRKKAREEDLRYAKQLHEQAEKDFQLEKVKEKSAQKLRIEHSLDLQSQSHNDRMRRTSPHFERMNANEIKMNRSILKKVKKEKTEGRLEAIYEKASLPSITKATFFS